MKKVYQALVKDTGDILESDTFKGLYRYALSHGRNYCFCYDRILVMELVASYYSDVVYINQYGYHQCDLLARETIAYMAVSLTGLTVDRMNDNHELDYQFQRWC